MLRAKLMKATWVKKRQWLSQTRDIAGLIRAHRMALALIFAAAQITENLTPPDSAYLNHFLPYLQ